MRAGEEVNRLYELLYAHYIECLEEYNYKEDGLDVNLTELRKVTGLRSLSREMMESLHKKLAHIFDIEFVPRTRIVGEVCTRRYRNIYLINYKKENNYAMQGRN